MVCLPVVKHCILSIQASAVESMVFVMLVLYIDIALHLYVIKLISDTNLQIY